MKKPKLKLGRYFFDFLSVFIAVIAAFGLNNWNDNRRDAIAEEKILIEIKNGLTQDLVDIGLNKKAHEVGLRYVTYFKRLIDDKEVELDSFRNSYVQLTSDNFSLMNVSGYESLKSKGLEIIRNDSIRSKIITLYEFNYQSIRKYEETSPQMQLFSNFYFPIQEIFSKHLIYNDAAIITGIKTPLRLSDKEKGDMHGYLFRILISHFVKNNEYDKIAIKIDELLIDIDKELANR